MIFSHRRKPLARIFLFGFAGVMAGGNVLDALAQTPAPLRVDPVLLGLPPVKRDEAPVSVEKSKAEVKPVTAPVVESRPVEEAAPPAKAAPAPAVVQDVPVKAKPEGRPETAVRPAPVAPVAAPVVAPTAPQPATAPVAAPVAAPVPMPTPRSPEKPAAAVPVAAPAANNRPALAKTETSTVTALGPLRVDPALLGLPPVAAVPADSAVPGVVRPAASVRTQLAMAPLAKKKPVDDGKTWYERLFAPVTTAYRDGGYEVYLPFETYHLRSKYSADKIATYQEKPKGIGFGKSFYNEKGNMEGVYALAFQDSHFLPMYMAGYGWQSIWRPAEDVRLGLGYVAGLMARTDIFHYVPFPIVLPAGSIAYKNFSLNGAFVPGGAGWGNVAFFWAKWEFGKDGERVGTPARPAPVEETELATTTFGPAVPLARQRVPYGPAVGVSGGASAAEAGAVAVPGGARGTGWSVEATKPPLVAATGLRDEEAVPDPGPALALKATRSMTPLATRSDEPRPVFLSAHRMGGDVDREFSAEGDAELRKVGTVLNADQMTYWPIEDEVQAEGNVRLEQDQSVVTGPRVRLRIEDQIGYFDQPSYLLKNQPKAGSKEAADKAFAEQFLQEQRRGDYWTSGFAMPRTAVIDIGSAPSLGRTMSDGRGEAERIDFEGENHYRLTNNTFTTCAPGDNGWYLRTSELTLDYDKERGEGKDGTLYFKDVPIFYSPWLPFSLNKQRKSGLLAPTFGATSDSGLSLSVPYYWDIAPNMDATISTREMTKRGLQLGTTFRYLDTALGGRYDGEARVEYLPGDKVKREDRYGVSLMHRQGTSSGFSGFINYNKVSDDTYFTDLSTFSTMTSQTQLLQQGSVSYAGGGWWNATANFQQYQTLQPDPKNPVLEQYRMLPQLTLNARKPDFFGTDSSFMGQYTAFSKPQQIINGVTTTDPNGQRLVLYPQLSVPYVMPGWYVTPKVGLNIRHYALSGQASGVSQSITTTLPVVSLDSGMTFERSSNWFGKDYTQTLEPRLYYVNIPYRNQDNIPIFDAALADFNFAQIFSENQFSGWDRVNNANQLTAAATSRLLDPKTGAELVRVMLGQRFYFSRNKVSLSANTIAAADERSWDKSDFLSAFSGQILPKVYADLAMQFNPTDRNFKRQSVGVRYLPEPGKVLNAAYRYNSDSSAPTNQVDFSAQWPLTGRLYGLGRFNYSFRDTGSTLSTTNQTGRLIQGVLGLEYKGGCWVVRGVVQRLALTSDKTSSAFFIQLELNDFASVGSNPISMLRRNIQGYSLINEPNTDFDYVQ